MSQFRMAVAGVLLGSIHTTAVLAAPDIEDIEDIADMLEVMVDDLETQGDGCGGALRVGEPTVIEDASGVLFASTSFLVSDGSTTELTGSVFLTVDPEAGTVEAVMAMTRDSVVYTLDLDVDLSDDELHICGSISYSSQTYTGGWTYSVANGLETDPGTQSGFEDAVIEIFGCDPENPLAWNLADGLQFVANVLIMGINYALDLGIEYTAPTQCDGPYFNDGSGQSCEDVEIPCKDSLAEMSEWLDDIPGATIGFKKCMKGRAGCGGSHFARLRVSCADSNDCGPCGNASGCSLAGTKIWYCRDDDIDECGCTGLVFHEMAHSCGKFDDPDPEAFQESNCPPDWDPDDFSGAERIGWWWNNECCGNGN